jgi:rhamnosyltransferase
MKNVIIIGSRGYRYNYGGWETFVTELINNSLDKDINFFVPYLTHDKLNDKKVTHINNLEQTELYTPNTGFTTMFKFTITSMNYYINYLKEHNLKNVVMLILGCKIGPLMPKYSHELKKLGVKVILNPDGIEWKRDKWAWWIKKCFKISEKYHVKYADHVVCDSNSIKEYIDDEYKVSNKTSFIAYGTYLDNKISDTARCKKFFKDNKIKENNYYLYVGRFVPENNIETIISEFMASNSTKRLVLVTNYEKNDFYNQLINNTKFEDDDRVLLLGPVYDKELLTYLRMNAYGYIHGHSAGGTNPSLLEALAYTKLNILFDVSYNKEVGKKSCYYFSKVKSSLARQINKCDKLTKKDINKLGNECLDIIKNNYTWPIIVNKYNDLFDNLIDN